MDSFGSKVKAAREAAGKTAEQVASMAGLNTPSYHDLENVNGELLRQVSLGELRRICDFLGISVRELFGEVGSLNSLISRETLLKKLKEHVTSSGMTVSAFEEKVGFEIGNVLHNSESIADWNVDCLRSVCQELHLNWKDALP